MHWFIGFLFLVFLYLLLNKLKNVQTPVVALNALLIKKIKGRDENYFFLLKIDDEEKKFLVSKEIYDKYKEKQKGKLVFKKTRFIDFIVD